MNASSPPCKPDNASNPAGTNATVQASGDGVGASSAGDGALPGRPARPGLDAPDAADGESLMAGGSLVFPVISEQVQVSTVSEHSGTVRVRKVVHQLSEPVSAPGYREVIETLRVPLNQVVQAVQPPWRQGDVLVVPVYEERLVRQLVLLEELHVKRRREPLDSGASASLRREEVIVERLDPQTGQWLREEP